MRGAALTTVYASLTGILAALFVAYLLTGSFGTVERSDYMTYHVAGQIVASGDGACLYDRSCQAAAEHALIGSGIFDGGTLWLNSPPTVALVAVPFSRLSLPVGFALWTAASLLLLGAAAWRLAWGDWKVRALATVLVISAWPTAVAVARGQMGIAAAALMGLSAALLPRTVAGIPAGLASLKPTLVPLLWLLLAVRRRWSGLLVTAGTAAVLVALTVLVAGPQAVLAYPGYLMSVSTDPSFHTHPEQMISWGGTASRLGSSGLAGALAVLGTAATLALVGLTWLWSRGSAYAAPLAVAAAFLAAPLVIPYANQDEAILGELAVLVLLAGIPPLRRLLVPVALGFHAVLWAGLLLGATGGAWLLFGAQLAWLGLVVLVAARERVEGGARLLRAS